jgi:phage gp45-like
MNLIQIIKSTDIVDEKNLDGEKVVSMSKGEGLNKYTTQNMCAPGFEFTPADGENLVIVPVNGSNSYMVTVAGTNENITPDCAKGERRLYSVSEDGSEIKAFAKFLNTGVIELNGNDNFAVLYNELKIAFDQLKDDQNAILNLLQTWTFVANDGGAALQTEANLLSPSTADMSSSKSENVLLKSN